MRISTVLFLLCIYSQVRAQTPPVRVYTITADSVKITNCDSSELIIENHSQGVPGFLFNTGNGRTVFKHGAVRLNDSMYIVGADTVNLGSAWMQGGNTFAATGILGTFDNNHLDFYTNGIARMRLTDSGRVGIGLSTPLEQLDIYGNLNLNDVGTTLAAYKLNHLPVLTFGSGANEYYNICIGDSSGINSGGGYRMTFAGYQAGMNNYGTGGTFLGSSAGTGNTGDENVFVGNMSGTDQEGSGNTFVGSSAGAISSNDDNTYVGYLSGYSPTGSFNVYMGAYAGEFVSGDNNVHVGNQSGQYSYGNFNILVGENAGAFNGGSHNVFVGTGTGLSDSYTGAGLVNEVTLLGDSADVTNISATNATAIGHKAVVNASNTMVFGDSLTTNWLFCSAAAPVSGAALVVGSDGTNGNGAYLSTGGTWTNASDKNKKENFQTVYGDEMLDKIGELPVTKWNYKGHREQHIGPVAQDFFRIFQVGTDDKSISTIDPSGITLVGIQALYKKWKTAEQRAEAQSSKLEKQAKELQALQQEVEELKQLIHNDARKKKN
jgi:Chaperone of endosialidase